MTNYSKMGVLVCVVVLVLWVFLLEILSSNSTDGCAVHTLDLNTDFFILLYTINSALNGLCNVVKV